MRNYPAQVGPGGEPVSDTASFTSSNANDVIQEEQNAITSSGQTLIPLANPADNTQLSQAMARYASGGIWGVESGAANAYVVSATGTFTAPDAYFDGMEIRFRAGNNNTIASTVNAFGIGVVDLVQEDGSALSADFITTSVDTIARYSTSAGDFFVTSAAGLNAVSGLPRSYLSGLQMANGTDTDHDIDISVGTARDAVNSANLALASIMTKQIDANWAIGTAAGGFPSGLTLAADTWYHVFVVDETGGATDAGFDTSLTATNLLADTGGTLYRRIGSVLTDASLNILAFVQDGNSFVWVDPPGDVSTTTLGTTATSFTLSTPPDVKTHAVMSAVGLHASNLKLYISSLDANDEAPDTTGTGPVPQLINGGANFDPGQIETRTNTSSQIRARAVASSTTLYITTLGFKDTRGRDD